MIEDELLKIPMEELTVETKPRIGVRVISEGGYSVALDTTITDELRNEGLARELIHKVQEMRKQAGFEISDRIKLRYQGSKDVKKAISQYLKHICNEILCLDLIEGEEISGDFVKDLNINGEHVQVGIEKIKGDK
jgi:isoleucyl-tRNA synthetase